ncbi:MAG: hypothetical protein ACRD07_04635 [Acidimicrobiales bacterium]
MRGCRARADRCSAAGFCAVVTDGDQRRFWIQAGLHDPEIVLARFDYAYDAEAAEGAAALGLDPSDLLEVIDAN